jgi:Spy/CpxP family protein refolding chaperone
MMMKRRTFIALLGTSVLAAAGGAAAQNASPRKRDGWGASAEKEFRVGAGMGPKLMTEDEWKEHQAKMRTLKGAERDAYRREMHDKMVARAKERGIDMRPGRGPAQ